MRKNIFFGHKKPAQAMVEFAIALPVLLLLLYGILEAGRLLFIYSTVVTASRQAARYGTTTGEGGGATPVYGAPRSVVPRYRDCAGIRGAANAVGYLTSGGFNIQLAYDKGPNTTPQPYCTTGGTTETSPADKPAENDLNGNSTRLVVTVSTQFVPIVPKLVPFVQRNITATSARTILYSVPIVVDQPPIIVPQSHTTTTVTTSPNPSSIGQDVTVTITVVDDDDATNIPQGTVLVTTTGQTCNPTLNSSGIATCTFNFTTSGDYTITAVYTPSDDDHITSTNIPAHIHKVELADTITKIIAPTENMWSLKGSTVTVSVTVSGGSTTPGGTVDIDGGGSNKCTITLVGGSGSCPISFNTIGDKTIYATYNGDPTHKTSTTSVIHHVVDATPTATIPPTIAPSTPTPTPTLSPTPVPTQVTGCGKNVSIVKDPATSRNLSYSGNQMSMKVSNFEVYPLTIASVIVTWNDDKGHSVSPKSLRLVSATVNGVTFWTGDIGGQSTYPISSGAFIGPAPVFPSMSTGTIIAFTFNQSYDIVEATDEIYITFQTPGCETFFIDSTP